MSRKDEESEYPDAATENANRIEELESKIAFQEDSLQQLDKALSQQQQQIFDLKEQLRYLNERIKEVESPSGSPQDAPPPHY